MKFREDLVFFQDVRVSRTLLEGPYVHVFGSNNPACYFWGYHESGLKGQYPQ